MIQQEYLYRGLSERRYNDDGIGGACYWENSLPGECVWRTGEPFTVRDQEYGTGPTFLFEKKKMVISMRGLRRTHRKSFFSSCVITERDMMQKPLAVEAEVLSHGILEMIQFPKNAEEPVPDPTYHMFDGTLTLYFLLMDSENGASMDGLYTILESQCFHGLQ